MAIDTLNWSVGQLKMKGFARSTETSIANFSPFNQMEREGED